MDDTPTPRQSGSWDRAPELRRYTLVIADKLAYVSSRKARVLAELDIAGSVRARRLERRARVLADNFGSWRTRNVDLDTRRSDIDELFAIQNEAEDFALDKVDLRS